MSKAAGPDGISAQMLKETASVIAPSLSKLFNCSLSQGYFPACWKLANVIPVPKPGSLNSSPSGYIPILLLSITSKVLEKHVYMFVYDYLSEHYPIAGGARQDNGNLRARIDNGLYVRALKDLRNEQSRA